MQFGINGGTRLLLGLGALAAFSAAATAQPNYPDRPIRFIVPNAPGGSTSVAARLVGEKLTTSWNEQVIIDNRPGGNNIVAGELLQRSAPDGQTILLVTAAHVINPIVHPEKAQYKTFLGFPPVATLVSTNYILVVNAAVPASNLKELIALAKSKPGELNAAVSNAGGIQHLALEYFNVLAGVKIQAIPYKGGGPGITDLIGGQVQLAFNNTLTLLPHIRSGKIRALGVGGDERNPVLPQLPTFAELGLPGYSVKNWFGVVVPPRTPKEIVDKLAGEIIRVQGMADFKQKLGVQGVEPFVNGPEQFAALIKTESAKYAKIIKAANIKLEN
ncbi:MAG: tripartite tricarboxylate transporter substrate binding protein [Betaproteobacteria bacterium]|nr:tripartite tricarboxylate transporter substrate binding protein [Betaproteobacteria bacterium]